VFSFLRRTADDVALPALSCGAAAAQLSAVPPAVQQSINISGRWAHSSKPVTATCGGRMGQTDGRPTVK